MKHLADSISCDLSKYWKIKYDQNKCDNMFHVDWICAGKYNFLLYPCKPWDYSTGSIIFQGTRYGEHITDRPSIRLVLDENMTHIDHAIVAHPEVHEVIEKEDILSVISNIYSFSFREVVVFAKKLKLLNVSII